MISQEKQKQPLSDGEWVTRVCQGTDSNPKRLKVLYNDGFYCIIKYPGSNLGGAPMRAWNPGCCRLEHVDDKPIGGIYLGTVVWDNAMDGRLTRKRLRALCKKLNLSEEHIRDKS